MLKLPVTPEQARVDVVLGNWLQRQYGQITRRSFLTGLTRKAISLGGISLAAHVFPFLVPEARAQAGTGALCGLHGYHCGSGTCHGGTAAFAWTACCQIPVSAPPCPTIFACCSYLDFCGTRPQGWPDGCAGPRAGSSWCAATGDYICTTSSCGATYQSSGECESYCLGPSC